MSKTAVAHTLEAIGETSPAGFAIALHVKFTAPRYLFQSYEKEWMETYSREGLVLRDPTVRWGFENTGSVKWSDLKPLDEGGVLDLAAEHGLKFGVTVALVKENSRSIASFSRPDREYTDQEIEQLSAALEKLHDETIATESLTPADHEAFKRMSVMLTHG